MRASATSPTGYCRPVSSCRRFAQMRKAIVAAMPTDPDLADAFRNGVIGWRKQAMTDMLHRGMARGEVRADVRIDVARELAQAFLWHRFLVTGDPITPELIEHVVDEVLIPYVRPDRTAGG